MLHPTPTPRPAARGSERGSAYVLALLTLLVVSVLGLSLVYITQTEMEIGSNERTLERTFYAADSGLAIAAARVLVTSDHRSTIIDVKEPGSPLNVRQVIEIAPTVPIYDAPCNLCEINNTGTYQDKAYRKINNLLAARASRVVGGRTTAVKTVSSMLELQPWKSPVEAYLAVGEPPP